MRRGCGRLPPPHPHPLPLGALMLLPLLAHGAAYLPGADSAVASPSVDLTPAGINSGNGSGLRWTLAPVRSNGTVALDLRSLRLDDGSRTTQALVYNDLDLSSYIWQPWFAQLRAGLGVLAERNQRSAPGQADTRSTSASLTGRLALAVFPASRFPFELRADLSDSRVSGDNLGADYRGQRLGLTQSWRPEIGNETLQLNIEHSRLSSVAGVDSVNFGQFTAFRQDGPHSLEFNASLTRNQREDAPGLLNNGSSSDLATTLGALGLRHGWRPDAGLSVDSLASWNTLEIGHRNGSSGSGSGGTRSFGLTRLGERLGLDAVEPEQASELRQLATTATWRPVAGSLLQPSSPLMVSATLRWADSGVNNAAGNDTNGLPLPASEQHVRSLFGSLGVSQELGRNWRLAGALAGGLVQPDHAAGRLTRNANAALSWAPVGGLLGDAWRYTPTATLNASAGDLRRRDTEASLASAAAAGVSTGLIPGSNSADPPTGLRRTVGLQLEHGVSRSLPLDDGRGSLAWTLTQGLGALRASPSAENARTLAHGASVYWQSSPVTDLGTAQSYAGLSLSDARAWAPLPSRFQLVNLQFSQRQQLARHASWSGDLTVQASRTDVSQIDAFTGEMRMASPGWQRYGNGTLSYEDQRFLGVARLRWSAIVGLHTEQLERRSLGDLDAPRERITQSIENRLDYSIGRLDTRLALRHARVDGRDITALQARVQRRY
jgi:hypothetical protein